MAAAARVSLVLLAALTCALSSAAAQECTACTEGFGVLIPGKNQSSPNGCGFGSTEGIVPDLKFGSCCNQHDNCYSTCTPKEFCDRQFYGCMKGICTTETYVGEYLCDQVADCYAAAVFTEASCGVWKSYQNEQCSCSPNATAPVVDYTGLPEMPDSAIKDICLNFSPDNDASSVRPLLVMTAIIAALVSMLLL